ncbi:MAG: 6-carboxytetrahydropterin synthase [bacterium]|jgi:6-pyruvoyltetrahydropterin/6-carboxytetrahydropterin synthase|nr:6-carboxytetrahydropterin synthase [Planctomycetota bacterium]HIL52533.1 6-carboxytetrahydropterin synthase [Planctomycetota bacterium]
MPAPQLDITHRLEFSAAHRLHDPALGDEANRQLYGPCNNPNGHGHNYEVEVTVRGEVPPSGMIVDLNVLALIMDEEIFAQVDHKHLNCDVPFLEGLVTTAENLCVAFWQRVQPRILALGGCRLLRVRVYECKNSYADYHGPQL